MVALGIYLFALEHSGEEARDWTTLFVEAESEFLRSVLPGETRDDPRRAALLAAEQAARRASRCSAADGTLVAQTTASGLGVKNG